MSSFGIRQQGSASTHTESELLAKLMLSPRSAELWYELGILQQQAGKFHQAVSSLRAADYLKPKEPSIIARLIESSLSANLIREAKELQTELLFLDYGAALTEHYIDDLCRRVDARVETQSTLRLKDLPRISVGIATRERLESISALIKSLREQSFTDFELIISDDSSSAELQGQLELRFPGMPFKYLRGPRENAPANRQNISRNASYPLLVIIDDDHILDSRCLELMVRTALENPYCGLVSAIWPDFGKNAFVLDQGRCENLDIASSSISTLHADDFPWWRQGRMTFSSLYEPGRVFSAMTTGGGCVLYRREFLSLIGGLPKRYSTVSFRDDASVSHLMYLWGFCPVIQPQAIAWHNRCETGGTRDTSNWAYDVSRDALIFLRSLDGWRESAFRRRAIVQRGKIKVALLASNLAPLSESLAAALANVTELRKITGTNGEEEINASDLVLCADSASLKKIQLLKLAKPLVLIGGSELATIAEGIGLKFQAVIYDTPTSSIESAPKHYSLDWGKVAQAGAASKRVPPSGILDQEIPFEELCLRMFLAETFQRALYPAAPPAEIPQEEVIEQSLGVRTGFHGGKPLTEAFYTRRSNSFRPFISVLVPVMADTKDPIGLLNSILNQSFDNFEVLAIQSATAATFSWPQDSRLKVLRSTDTTLSRLLNEGLRHANGRWITWVDHGGLVTGALEFIVKTIETDPSERCFLFADQASASPDVQHLFATPGELQLLSFVRGYPLPGALPVVRSSTPKELRGFRDLHGLCATYDFILRAASFFVWEVRPGALISGPHPEIDYDTLFGCMASALDFIDTHDLTRIFPWISFEDPEHVVYIYSSLITVCVSTAFSELEHLSLRGALMARAAEWFSTQATDSVIEQLNSSLLKFLRERSDLNTLPLAMRPYYSQLLDINRSRFWYRPFHPFKLLNFSLSEYERMGAPEAAPLKEFLKKYGELR